MLHFCKLIRLLHCVDARTLNQFGMIYARFVRYKTTNLWHSILYRAGNQRGCGRGSGFSLENHKGELL